MAREIPSLTGFQLRDKLYDALKRYPLPSTLMPSLASELVGLVNEGINALLVAEFRAATVKESLDVASAPPRTDSGGTTP